MSLHHTRMQGIEQRIQKVRAQRLGPAQQSNEIAAILREAPNGFRWWWNDRTGEVTETPRGEAPSWAK